VAAFWFGGETGLIIAALGLPLVYLLVGATRPHAGRTLDQSSPATLIAKSDFESVVDAYFAKASKTGKHSAVFCVAVADFEDLADRYGQIAAETVIARTGERLQAVLREDDRVGLLGDARFGIAIGPVDQLDLELCIQLAGRLQTALEDPIALDGTTIYITASIGFCQHARAPAGGGAKWLHAAILAQRAAHRCDTSAIRAFSEQMERENLTRAELREDVIRALNAGEIQPWYQPQISTDTGEITGFEALARWIHCDRGIISPAEFLPAIAEAGQLERLAEVMMYQACAALKSWEAADVFVPQIGVNFAGSELSNPKLIEKIKWELDRFELTPERLAIEVLETVVAGSPDDVITRNILGLGKLGCKIDLDDFGTGHASIASVRRFSVNRIKIDRSFVMKADRDPDQQRMIGAILTMAERLGIETLAEGVETVGEHVLLAQLGCDHVQGFGIAHPMPLDQTLDWIAAHNAKLQDVPQIMNGKAS
jgi:EAL domain-containing protein (putative c-di-GMP-specific phosphodiesterase class I)/GGDEF domain-containing protein